MAEKTQYLLIGGGVASASAAESIRERQPQASIVMLSREHYFPYHRPPLSKGYLIEGDWEPSDIYHNEEEWYGENDITCRLGVKATQLDLHRRTTTLSTGETLAYEKLLLATGGELIKLNVPGADLEGLYYLREIPDSDALISASETSGRAVAVGGGFIGLELASAFRQRDLEVTLVYMEDRLWERMLSPEISRWLADYYRSKGITLMNNSEVAEFQGRGKVKTVVLKSGKKLNTDMVALGIGVRPNLTLVKGTALAGENGVPVNEYLETEISGVYAAGDIAWYQDIIFDKRRRVEHFEVARGQGETAGANMAGEGEPYRELPYFFSDLFDLAFEFVGDFELKPDRVDFTGKLADNTFIARYYKDNRIVAAVFVGREEEEVEAVKEDILDAHE